MSELEHLVTGKQAVVVDVRPRAFFALGHIPGALNLPLEELQAGSASSNHPLPFSPATSLVVYCADVSCPTARSAGVILQQRGYRRVAVFTGGWYFWMRAHLPIETAP